MYKNSQTCRKTCRIHLPVIILFEDIEGGCLKYITSISKDWDHNKGFAKVTSTTWLAIHYVEKRYCHHALERLKFLGMYKQFELSSELQKTNVNNFFFLIKQTHPFLSLPSPMKVYTHLAQGPIS